MNKAKFEPEDGQVLLFVGQELHAIGGLEAYNDGYLDHYKKPAGFTMYTNLAPGDTSFGYIQKGLDGVWTTDDWGDNVSNMSLQLGDPNFENMALAIGLSMVNHEEAVAKGERDDLIKKLGSFLQGLAPRPVFLRIGYEFDGHLWNHYDRIFYLKAYRRIKNIYDDMGITNVAFVWQSTGFVSNQEQLEAWYPGDDYVDWCAFSFFARWKEEEMIEFARKNDKPVFIAEASPTISDFTVKFDGNTKETILSNPEQAKEAWSKWFKPFFKTINDNPDVVKAISYINCHWKAHEMWKENPTFKRVDARLHTSKLIDGKWKKEISKEKYIHSSPTLYEDLGSHLNQQASGKD
ncbi:endo-1,3-beta-xylanase [Cytophagales bacterium RKSG123]|nr:endo-1,3-beta-xylanase [Xanthovirga aplysinae]